MNTQHLSEIGQWWIATLERSIGDIFTKRTAQKAPVIEIGRFHIRLAAPDLSVEINHEDLDAELLASYLKTRQAPVIALERDRYVLRRLSSIRVPAARARAMASFDLQSATPFKPDEVYCLLIESASDPSPSETAYAVIKRDVVDTLLRTLHPIGIEPRAMVLLPALDRGLRIRKIERTDFQALLVKKTWQNRYRNLMGMLLVLLMVATVSNAHFNLSEAEAAANTPVAELEKKAVKIRKEIDDRATKIDEFNALLENTIARRSMSEIWEELSIALPDSAYLTELYINNSIIRLTGYSKSTASMIVPLEGSRMFENAEFSSAVVKVPGEEGERFQLSLELASQ